ncbi:hypothetical protein ANN_22422 [Periplaneta americana]|uniref:MADF domain-containing protein n=1 Tax=Periplaneta americana TaxID=6978 RepID=A0ABQ8S865_PERAM|nr:hypothetical protein ANN_22422 [Periplaneta americana]
MAVVFRDSYWTPAIVVFVAVAIVFFFIIIIIIIITTICTGIYMKCQTRINIDIEVGSIVTRYMCFPCRLQSTMRADKNSIKHATMRVLLFQIVFSPGIPLPPQPVLTRWKTWLDALNYYAEYYGKIMEQEDRDITYALFCSVLCIMEQVLFDEILIFSVEENPHVYDKRRASYKDEKMKENTWLSIAASLNTDRYFTTLYQHLRLFSVEYDEGDNAGEMSTGSSTESDPAFARIRLRENPEKTSTSIIELQSWKRVANGVDPEIFYFKNILPEINGFFSKEGLSSSEWRDAIKMNANVAPVRSLHGRSLDGFRCRYCNEIETLAHVLGSCQHGELLRNSRHHNIRKLIAQALRNKSFEVHEEVHCVASQGGGIRRADIVALDKTNSKGFILDPTVRFEMSQTQPFEVNKEKQQIYEPTIPYFREKYQMEGTWEVHGLMIGARGTIPRSTVNTIKTFGIHDIIPKIITSTIKGSVAILKNHLYGIS